MAASEMRSRKTRYGRSSARILTITRIGLDMLSCCIRTYVRICDLLRAHPPPLADERAGGPARDDRDGRSPSPPRPGGQQVIGEVSGAAEAFGVRAGMRLAEALGRCPPLPLVAADPVRAEASWERVAARLEGIGAAVEPARPGEAFFGVERLARPLREPREGPGPRRRALGPPVARRRRPDPPLRLRRRAADARPAVPP